MLEEAREAPARIADLLAADADLVRDLAARLRADRPRFAVTIARGSSDHAATYAAYLLGSRLGVVTASLPPSLETLGHADLDLKGAWRSPCRSPAAARTWYAGPPRPRARGADRRHPEFDRQPGRPGSGDRPGPACRGERASPRPNPISPAWSSPPGWSPNGPRIPS